MKQLLFVSVVASVFLTGCALTHERVVQRAKAKSDTELCMASIKFPQYGDVIAAELKQRGYTCDWELAKAQVQAEANTAARRAAALQAAAASFDAQPTKPQLPTQLATAPAAAPAFIPAAPTAYFTGKQQQVQTVTNQYGWTCEYNYAGRTFTRTFVGMCPSSVQVQ